MSEQRSLGVRAEGGVLHVQLNRPAIHNALDGPLVEDLRSLFASLLPGGERASGGVRALVLSGAGQSFCAGADLAWMRTVAEFGREENRRDALALSGMLRALDGCVVPTVARVQGAALGGGMGLLACCDVVVAAEDARFGFTEARLGLLPAVIAPFVVARIGPGQARALFVSATRFDAARALRIGLVHHVVAEGDLDREVERVVSDLLTGAPGTAAGARELIVRVTGQGAGKVEEYTTGLLARLRAGEEGREGLSAFLEKRPPSWVHRPPTGPV